MANFGNGGKNVGIENPLISTSEGGGGCISGEAISWLSFLADSTVADSIVFASNGADAGTFGDKKETVDGVVAEFTECGLGNVGGVKAVYGSNRADVA